MKKLYFLDIDSTNCYPLEDYTEEELDDNNRELVEAIPDNDNKDFVWCTYYGEVAQREDCKKSECPYYTSKSGRGVCSNRGKLYKHGETIKF